MRDAVARDFVELPMQRNRIRRGQRSVECTFRRYQSDGADAGRGVTEALPDLARKGRDRGLAAGSGYSRDGFGLPRIEFRRGERQRAARIGGNDERHPGPALRRVIGRHRDRAGGNRSIDEARAIGLVACEREEQVAGLHRAAVHGEAGDRNCFRLRIDHGVIAEQVAKFHQYELAATDAGT